MEKVAISDYAAFVGATTGVAALLWHMVIWWFERRTKLKLSRERVTLLWEDASSSEIQRTLDALIVRVTNEGKLPVTIVDFFLQPTAKANPIPYAGPTLDGSHLPFSLCHKGNKEFHYPIEQIQQHFGVAPETLKCWVEDALRRRYEVPVAKELRPAGVRQWNPSSRQGGSP